MTSGYRYGQTCIFYIWISGRKLFKRLICKSHKMENCAPGLTSWNFVFCFFPFIKTLYPPVCSTVLAWPKVEQKGRVILLFNETSFLSRASAFSRKAENFETNFHLSLSLSLLLFLSFIWGNWGYQKMSACLGKGRKLMRVTQCYFCQLKIGQNC